MTPASVVCLTARSPSRRLLLMLDLSQLELMLPTDPSSCTTLVSTRSPHAAPSSLTTVFLLSDMVSMTEPHTGWSRTHGAPHGEWIYIMMARNHNNMCGIATDA